MSRRPVSICMLAAVLSGCARSDTRELEAGPRPAVAQAIKLYLDGRATDAVSVTRPRRAVVAVVNLGVGTKEGPATAADLYAVLPRAVETDGDFGRIAALPGVSAVVLLNPLVMDQALPAERAFREAAERVGADVLCVYSIRTRLVDDRLAPLTQDLSLVFSLGVVPFAYQRYETTASAVMIDFRSGAVLVAAEGVSGEKAVINAHNYQGGPGRRAMARAFGRMTARLAAAWKALPVDGETRGPAGKGRP